LRRFFAYRRSSAHVVACARRLEQKISDAGTSNQRIDPHILMISAVEAGPLRAFGVAQAPNSKPNREDAYNHQKAKKKNDDDDSRRR
jgi:hypothetical protein